MNVYCVPNKDKIIKKNEIPMKKSLEEKIQLLAEWIYESQYLVVFTGAGISTESGLPDFRGPNGLWTRQDKGLPPPPMTTPWEDMEPNKGHLAIVDLQKLGKLKFIISQNVDNLHLKSGIHPDLIAELHGNRTKLRCTSCGKTYDKSTGQTKCSCGGRLIGSVVDFGQSLPEKDLMLSFEHSSKCDLFIVLGSSLVVSPASDMPMQALQAGAKLVIINKGETPYDRYTALSFSENIGEVMPGVIKRLRNMMGFY